MGNAVRAALRVRRLSAPEETPAAQPTMMRFRRANLPRMEKGSAQRQGDVARLAFEVLGREAALVFLNTEHAALGGRPIDLAVVSDEGRASVIAELERLTAQRGEVPA